MIRLLEVYLGHQQEKKKTESSYTLYNIDGEFIRITITFIVKNRKFNVIDIGEASTAHSNYILWEPDLDVDDEIHFG